MKFTILPPKRTAFVLDLQKDGKCSDGSAMPVQSFPLTRLEVIKLRAALTRALHESNGAE